MLTIKAMVKKDGMRVDRKYNVKLSFTYKRKVKRLSTSLFVSAGISSISFYSTKVVIYFQLFFVLSQQSANFGCILLFLTTLPLFLWSFV